MKCECKVCPVHLVIRIYKCVIERCKAVVKAITGK